MTKLYLLNPYDKEVVYDGVSYHTSASIKYRCDGPLCKKIVAHPNRIISPCGNKHFCCLECAKNFCKENNIPIISDNKDDIFRAIKKVFKSHSPFHNETLIRLKSYFTKEKLIEGIKYSKLRAELFPNSPLTKSLKLKIIKYFSLIECKVNGRVIFYSKEGYELAKNSGKLSKNRPTWFSYETESKIREYLKDKESFYFIDLNRIIQIKHLTSYKNLKEKLKEVFNLEEKTIYGRVIFFKKTIPIINSDAQNGIPINNLDVQNENSNLHPSIDN